MEQSVVVAEASVVKVTDAWYGITVNWGFHVADGYQQKQVPPVKADRLAHASIAARSPLPDHSLHFGRFQRPTRLPITRIGLRLLTLS